MNPLNIDRLNEEFKEASIGEILEFCDQTFGNQLVLASSLGLEDQLLTVSLLNVNKKARIFVLETGRLNKETLDVMKATEETYKFSYEIYKPIKKDVIRLVKEKGEFSFYESIENRKECCDIRKVEPLKRVLKTAKAWITGLRKEQSLTRTDLNLFEFDNANQMVKINPLVNWSFEDVFAQVKKSNIPYNTLHDKGYPSIGCEPCTRAIQPGENQRAGRWWWENPDSKECGLHIVDGKLVRSKEIL